MSLDNTIARTGCACNPDTDTVCGYHGDWIGKQQGPIVILYGEGWTGGNGVTVSDSSSIKRTDPTKLLPAFKGTATDQQGNKVGTKHYRKLAAQVKKVAELTEARRKL